MIHVEHRRIIGDPCGNLDEIQTPLMKGLTMSVKKQNIVKSEKSVLEHPPVAGKSKKIKPANSSQSYYAGGTADLTAAIEDIHAALDKLEEKGIGKREKGRDSHSSSLTPLPSPRSPQTKATPPAGNNMATYLQTWFEELQVMFDNFSEIVPELGDTVLSPADRKRLLGSGVRRYGHIEKVFEVAQEYPQFWPGFLEEGSDLAGRVQEIDALRNLTILFQYYFRVTSDMLLVSGHDAFRIANSYYTTVRDAARRGGTPEAAQVFEKLKLFWHRRRPSSSSEEPMQLELELDFTCPHHGKHPHHDHADGTTVLAIESDPVANGEEVVIDDMPRKPRGARHRHNPTVKAGDRIREE